MFDPSIGLLFLVDSAGSNIPIENYQGDRQALSLVMFD